VIHTACTYKQIKVQPQGSVSQADGSAHETARPHCFSSSTLELPHEGNTLFNLTQKLTQEISSYGYWMRANDPSAGSPTETLLRLLLPLSVKVHQTFHGNAQELNTAAVRIIHRNTQSVGATGGVYKGQGRNQHELMTRAY
jgi:hypothetical protein